MFEINVKPEDIDKFVTEAIVNSCIGKAIQEAIKSYKPGSEYESFTSGGEG